MTNPEREKAYDDLEAREKKLLGGTQTDESEGSKCPCKKEGTLGGGNNMRCTE